MARPLSFVRLDIAHFGIEISDRPDDKTLADWVRKFHRSLALQDSTLCEFGSKLLKECAEFREIDAKRKRNPKESTRIQRKDVESNTEQIIKTAPKEGLVPLETLNAIEDNWEVKSKDLFDQEPAKTGPIISSLPEIFTRSTEKEKKDPPTPLTVTKRNREVKKFVIPTVEEVAEYITSRKSPVDPITFHSHYETNGWKRKGTPIENWKACVVTWERRIALEAKPTTKTYRGSLV